jgi:hypothetical protein
LRHLLLHSILAIQKTQTLSQDTIFSTAILWIWRPPVTSNWCSEFIMFDDSWLGVDDSSTFPCCCSYTSGVLFRQ